MPGSWIIPGFLQVFLEISAALFFLLSCQSPAAGFNPQQIVLSPKIMDKGVVPPAYLAAFVCKYNSNLSEEQAASLASIYWHEAAAEGVNSDIAFSQMCLETGFLRFGGQVKPEQNNFCGLGALDNGAAGAYFSSMQEGVRAHVQHLKAYASTEALRYKRTDPRFDLVSRGTVTDFYGLSGKWATDPEYHNKLEYMLCRLYLYVKNDYQIINQKP